MVEWLNLDALENLLRQPVDRPLNPLYFKRVKSDLACLFEAYDALLLEVEELKSESQKKRKAESDEV